MRPSEKTKRTGNEPPPDINALVTYVRVPESSKKNSSDPTCTVREALQTI